MKSRGLVLLLLAGVAASACSSGSSAPPSAPALTPPPPPPPPPTPTPAQLLDTPEYRRSGAAVQANVLPAWAAGFEGAGVIVGIVDSGIDQASPEFTGRIHPASRDVTGSNRGIGDQDGHGTAVAGVLAAARNDRSIVGIAPRAELAIMRGDRAGTCAAESGCSFTDSSVAAGVNAATDAGARVINLSLGGSSGTATLRQAFARATSAGVVLVIGAGNDAQAEIDPLPRSALQSANRDLVIVAGAATAGGDIASFSNRAGAAAGNFLLAPGTQIRSFDNEGREFLYSGTSLAAPVVAGAVALLAGAFPNLTGAQIVDLLFTTATDLGAPGPDPVYGHGLLNIARAFQPQGTTTLAGTRIALPLDNNGALGSALGSGTSFGNALGTIRFHDSYDRPYDLEVGRTLRPAHAGRLHGALLDSPGTWGTLALRQGDIALALTGAARTGLPGLPPGADPDAHLGLAQRGLGYWSSAARRPADSGVAASFGATTFAFGTGIAAPLLPGEAAPASLVAADALAIAASPGLLRERTMVAVRAAGMDVAVARTRSTRALGRAPGVALLADTHRTTLALAGDVGRMRLSGQLASEAEEGAFLGTGLTPAFGLAGASSRYAGLAADLPLGPLAIRAAGLWGWHDAALRPDSILVGQSGIRSSAWSGAIAAPLGRGLVSLTLSSPLALTGGGFAVDGRDGDIRFAPLGVTAREKVVEAGYALGPVRLSLFHRAHPGHQPIGSDTGFALRFSTGF